MRTSRSALRLPFGDRFFEDLDQQLRAREWVGCLEQLLAIELVDVCELRHAVDQPFIGNVRRDADQSSAAAGFLNQLLKPQSSRMQRWPVRVAERIGNRG